ncbi:DUF3515 family protein [Streptomyces rimosus]|uniref:DUF3515 family protein n=1 Tax=Streptomyces rimosus TaxID=1927 RepID=UPI0033F5BEE6
MIALSAASPPGRESAPNAGHPACGRAAAHYPSQLLGKERSSTSAEGVAIWGDGAVVLRCGTAPPQTDHRPLLQRERRGLGATGRGVGQRRAGSHHVRTRPRRRGNRGGSLSFGR